MAITQPIFKPGTPDFVWQQIQIIPTDGNNDDDDNDNNDDNNDNYDDDEKPKWPYLSQSSSLDLQIFRGSRLG